MKTEPSLILINNCYLYTFSGFVLNKNKYVDTFEKINLRSNKKVWEIIKPKLADNMKFSQIFFGVSHHLTGEVIFLGSLQTETIKEDEQKYYFIFDYTNDTLKFADVTYLCIELSEKFFIPLSEGNNFLIPNMERDNINLLRYTVTDKITQIFFESDPEHSIYNHAHPFNEFTLFQDEDYKRIEYIPKDLTHRANVFIEEPKPTPQSQKKRTDEIQINNEIDNK